MFDKMEGLIWIIIGVFLIIVGIIISFIAWGWKNRSDPTVGWTWGMILLLVAGIIIGIIGVILAFIGLWKQITAPIIPNVLSVYLGQFPTQELRDIAANNLVNKCNAADFYELEELAKNPLYRSIRTCELKFRKSGLW